MLFISFHKCFLVGFEILKQILFHVMYISFCLCCLTFWIKRRKRKRNERSTTGDREPFHKELILIRAFVDFILLSSAIFFHNLFVFFLILWCFGFLGARVRFLSNKDYFSNRNSSKPMNNFIILFWFYMKGVSRFVWTKITHGWIPVPQGELVGFFRCIPWASFLPSTVSFFLMVERAVSPKVW